MSFDDGHRNALEQNRQMTIGRAVPTYAGAPSRTMDAAAQKRLTVADIFPSNGARLPLTLEVWCAVLDHHGVSDDNERYRLLGDIGARGWIAR